MTPVLAAGAYLFLYSPSVMNPVVTNKLEPPPTSQLASDKTREIRITGTLEVPGILKPIIQGSKGTFGHKIVVMKGNALPDVVDATFSFPESSFPIKFIATLPGGFLASLRESGTLARLDLYYCFGKIAPAECNPNSGKVLRARVVLMPDATSLASGKIDLGRVYFTRSIPYPVEAATAGWSTEALAKHLEEVCGPGNSSITGKIVFTDEFVSKIPPGKQLALAILPYNFSLKDLKQVEAIPHIQFISPKEPNFSFPRSRFYLPTHFVPIAALCDEGLSLKDCVGKTLELKKVAFLLSAKDVFPLVPKDLRVPYCNETSPLTLYLHSFDPSVGHAENDKPKDSRLPPELFEGAYQ